MKAVYQNRVLKSEMLKQVKTNLWAYSEDGEPLTDNVVCWRFRARSKVKSSLTIFSICDPIQNHILLVGANGCSPEEGEALSQAKAANVSTMLFLVLSRSHLLTACFSGIACCMLILALMNGKLYLADQVGGTHEKGMVDTYVVCWHVFDFVRIDF
jgi:hypothetical protein